MEQYRLRNSIVNAVKYTGENDAEIKATCPTVLDPRRERPYLIIINMVGEKIWDTHPLKPGQWVVDVGYKIEVMEEETFKEKYEKL